MPQLDRDGSLESPWPILPPESPLPPDGPVLLDLARFQALDGARNAPTGVVIDSKTPHDVLDSLAARAAAFAVRFLLFRDGRGFTLVRRLRERHGYDGPILVLGHVLPDQWQHLRRLGATGVILPHEADLAPWQRAAARFSATYQPAFADARDRPGIGLLPTAG